MSNAFLALDSGGKRFPALDLRQKRIARSLLSWGMRMCGHTFSKWSHHLSQLWAAAEKAFLPLEIGRLSYMPCGNLSQKRSTMFSLVASDFRDLASLKSAFLALGRGQSSFSRSKKWLSSLCSILLVQGSAIHALFSGRPRFPSTGHSSTQL